MFFIVLCQQKIGIGIILTLIHSGSFLLMGFFLTILQQSMHKQVWEVEWE